MYTYNTCYGKPLSSTGLRALLCEGRIKVQCYIQTDKNSLKTIQNIQVHIKCLKALCLKLLREEHDWVDESKVL